MKALSKIILTVFSALMMLAFCASFAHAANTPCHGYELQNTGSNSGTWGVKVNNVFSTVDKNFGGLLVKDVSGNTNVIVSASDAQNVYQQMTGTITGNIKYVLPNTCGLYIIDNQTTGAYTITAVNTALGTGVLIPTGQKAFVYSNASTSTVTLATDLTTGILPSANGGTGNGFTKFSGPTTSEKTFTLPDASTTILTTNALVTIAQGGTGQATFSSAFNALSPLTTKGDLLIFASATNARLPVGTDGYYLTADSTQPSGLAYKQPALAGITGQFRNLAIGALGIANNSAVLTADELTLEDTSNNSMTAKTVSVTINDTVSGTNGLDTGTAANSTWYYVWVIYNPTTTTTAGLLSLSASSPTMPSGYTFKSRFGTVRTDSSGSKYLLQTQQYGRSVQYVVRSGSNLTALPVAASGTSGSFSAGVVTAWASVATGSYVPPLASRIAGQIYIVSGQAGFVTPNQQWTGSYVSASQAIGLAPSGGAATVPFNYILESSNIYWATLSGGALYITGWEENL